jgi:chromosomal replication initiation ATPase DnaA
MTTMPHPRPEELICAAAKALDVPLDELVGNRRSPAVIEARRIIVLLLRQWFGASYPEIRALIRAEATGHTAIIAMHRKAVRLMRSPAFAERLETAEAAFCRAWAARVASAVPTSATYARRAS